MIDKLEYKVIKSKEIWMQHEDNQSRIGEIQKYLNDLGIKGWELIIVDNNIAIFKHKL